MASSNDELLDASIRRQIGLLRLSRKVQLEILDLLDESDRLTLEKIAARLGQAGESLSPATVLRLTKLERSIRKLRRATWEDIAKIWRAELTALTINEPKHTAGIIKTISPVILTPNMPSAELLRALVRNNPFEGRTLRQWAAKQSRDDVERILGRIRVGMVQGQDNRTIMRQVRAGMQITRRDAEFVTRTSTNHFSNQARRQFFRQNRDIIPKEVFVATLDSRTTKICASLDGELFPTGKGPIPPLHGNCRSTRAGVLDGEVLGERPMKPVTERQLLREFPGSAGAKTRAALPRGTKGAFDRFSRSRVRELVGTVPARTTYEEFLGRQSVAFQDDWLGRDKARLFRRGKLPLKKFVDRAGSELSLSELAVREREAFVAAGMDPEDFL